MAPTGKRADNAGGSVKRGGASLRGRAGRVFAWALRQAEGSWVLRDQGTRGRRPLGQPIRLGRAGTRTLGDQVVALGRPEWLHADQFPAVGAESVHGPAGKVLRCSSLAITLPRPRPRPARGNPYTPLYIPRTPCLVPFNARTTRNVQTRRARRNPPTWVPPGHLLPLSHSGRRFASAAGSIKQLCRLAEAHSAIRHSSNAP